MIKFRLFFIITLLFTVSVNAQQIEESLPLTNKAIQKEQWILQDWDKNIILQWTDTALEISLLNQGVNQDLQTTVYAKIPIKAITKTNNGVVVKTGAVEFTQTYVKIDWSQSDLDFFKVSGNSSLLISNTNDVLTISKNGFKRYQFYTEPFDRMCKFISRFNWSLIALDRNSNIIPSLYASFQLSGNSIIGSVGGTPFVVDLEILYHQDKFLFKSIKFNPHYKESKKLQKKYSKYFTNQLYHYDIAEQTLNFYKDDQLVLMFGSMPKQE